MRVVHSAASMQVKIINRRYSFSIPMTLDHLGEFLVGLESLPLARKQPNQNCQSIEMNLQQYSDLTFFRAD